MSRTQPGWSQEHLGTACDHGRMTQLDGVDHSGRSIQELLYPDVPCFGCGSGNVKGLRLRSYPAEDAVSARFTPWPEHDNGLGYLNGGIISTVMDCHSGAAVMWEADGRGWPPLPGAALSYVTAGLDVRFLRPSPLDESVELRAWVGAVSEAEISCAVELLWEGTVRATATALWKRWRPRQEPPERPR
jgi:acyl-coenzyme A thioesterase PaaI-like protein